MCWMGRLICTYLRPLDVHVRIVDDAADQHLVLLGQLEDAVLVGTPLRAELNATHHRRALLFLVC